jgi:hypothetical protein
LTLILAQKIAQRGDAVGAPLVEQRLETAVILKPQRYGREIEHVGVDVAVANAAGSTAIGLLTF